MQRLGACRFRPGSPTNIRLTSREKENISRRSFARTRSSLAALLLAVLLFAMFFNCANNLSRIASNWNRRKSTQIVGEIFRATFSRVWVCKGKFHIKNGVQNGKFHANFTLLGRSVETWFWNSRLHLRALGHPREDQHRRCRLASQCTQLPYWPGGGVDTEFPHRLPGSMIGARAMTTLPLTIKFSHSKMLFMELPQKNDFLDDFPLCPQCPRPPPLQKQRKFYFYCRLAVSEILNYSVATADPRGEKYFIFANFGR